MTIQRIKEILVKADKGGSQINGSKVSVIALRVAEDTRNLEKQTEEGRVARKYVDEQFRAFKAFYTKAGDKEASSLKKQDFLEACAQFTEEREKEAVTPASSLSFTAKAFLGLLAVSSVFTPAASLALNQSAATSTCRGPLSETTVPCWTKQLAISGDVSPNMTAVQMSEVKSLFGLSYFATRVAGYNKGILDSQPVIDSFNASLTLCKEQKAILENNFNKSLSEQGSISSQLSSCQLELEGAVSEIQNNCSESQPLVASPSSIENPDPSKSEGYSGSVVVAVGSAAFAAGAFASQVAKSAARKLCGERPSESSAERVRASQVAPSEARAV